MERSAFARIDIHHQWIHQDEKWSTASLVECEPDVRSGERLACPRFGFDPLHKEG